MTMKQTTSGQKSKLFWLDDRPWSILEQHPPTKQTGPKRKDDRRIISGIIHVWQSGCRWQDCPLDYGPSTTVYHRFHRWVTCGIWEGAVNDLTSSVGPRYESSIDSTIIKAHRSASAKKGAAAKPSAKAGADGRRQSMLWRMNKAVRSRFCSRRATRPPARRPSRCWSRSRRQGRFWATRPRTATICGHG